MVASSRLCLAVLAATVWLPGPSCSNGASGPAPARPTDLAAETAGPGCVRITWTDTATDETEFAVLRRRAGEAFAVVAVLPANTSTFVDRGLEPATDWTYIVQTQRGTERSGRSAEATARTAASGFAVFSRGDGSGGEELYLASADGVLAPTRIASHPGQTVLGIATPADGARSWMAYQTSADASTWVVDVHVAPLECADPSEVRFLGRGETFEPVEIASDRFAIAALHDPPRLVAFDLETGTEETLASFASGRVTAAPTAPFAETGEFAMTHSDDPASVGAYAVAADGSSGPRLLLTGIVSSSITDDLFGFPAVRGSGAVVSQCHSTTCAYRTLVLVRDDGAVRQVVAGLSASGLGFAAFRMLLRDDFVVCRDWAIEPGIHPYATDLYSVSVTDGRRTNLTAASVDERVEWDGDTSDASAVFVGLMRDGTPTGIYSVPLDGSMPPVQLSTVGPAPNPVGELSEGLTTIGEWVFFTRQSTPDDLFVAEVGVAGSEQRVPIDGRVVSVSREDEPVAAPNAPPAARRMIARATRDADGQTYTDYWSVAPSGAGGLDVVALSDRFGTQTLPDASAAAAIPGSTPKVGRILYLRGNDLFSAEPGVANSELRLSQLANPISTTYWDPASADPNAFFVSDSQVWVAPVDASTPARQLSELQPGTGVALHATDDGGNIWFTTTAASGPILWVAEPGTARSALPIAPVDSEQSFRFAF